MRWLVPLLAHLIVCCQASRLNTTLVSSLSSYSTIFGTSPGFSWKNWTGLSVASNFSSIDDDTLQIKAIPWHHYNLKSKESENETFLPLSPHLGRGVDIYIVDCGIDTEHPEFNCRAQEIYNPYKSPRYCYDHGTPVASMAAGLVCGLAKSSRIFSVVIGLCPEATVHPQRHYEDSLKITNADAVNAFSSIVDHMRKQLAEKQRAAKAAGWTDTQVQAIPLRRAIINISMGYRSESDSIAKSVLQMLFDMPNVILTVAAGNEGIDAAKYWPANDERFFTVGGYNRHGGLYASSNWGKVVDAYGPGEQVLAAQINSPWGYTLATGTSFAAPYIAGWMAAYWDLNPKLTSLQVQEAARKAFCHIVSDAAL